MDKQRKDNSMSKRNIDNNDNINIDSRETEISKRKKMIILVSMIR